MKNVSFEHTLSWRKIRRGAAALLAGCVLACGLAACGGDEKGQENSSDVGGTASFAPIATPSPTPAPAAKAGKVTADELYVRESPSTDAEILGSVVDGDRLALMADTPQNDWYSVWYEGKTAYVYADYVEVVEVTADEYNQLMAASTPSPTDAPESGAEGSQAPESGAASPTPAINDEDGE